MANNQANKTTREPRRRTVFGPYNRLTKPTGPINFQPNSEKPQEQSNRIPEVIDLTADEPLEDVTNLPNKADRQVASHPALRPRVLPSEHQYLHTDPNENLSAPRRPLVDRGLNAVNRRPPAREKSGKARAEGAIRKLVNTQSHPHLALMTDCIPEFVRSGRRNAVIAGLYGSDLPSNSHQDEASNQPERPLKRRREPRVDTTYHFADLSGDGPIT